MTKDRVRGLKKEFDASEHGGAPLLGLSKPVIKAHGNSDAKAIRNAIRQAVTFIETESIKEFEELPRDLSYPRNNPRSIISRFAAEAFGKFYCFAAD